MTQDDRFGWDYPPGVTGREPQISGPPDDDDVITSEDIDDWYAGMTPQEIEDLCDADD